MTNTTTTADMDQSAAAALFRSIDPSPKKRRTEQVALSEGCQPGEYDVLCGRGRTAYSSVGNQRFYRTIERNMDRYFSLGNRHNKAEIIMEIVASIREAGGRFLKKDEDSSLWFEIGDKMARDKVGHAFRDTKAKQNKLKSKTLQASPEDTKTNEETSIDKDSLLEQALRKRVDDLFRIGTELGLASTAQGGLKFESDIGMESFSSSTSNRKKKKKDKMPPIDAGFTPAANGTLLAQCAMQLIPSSSDTQEPNDLEPTSADCLDQMEDDLIPMNPECNSSPNQSMGWEMDSASPLLFSPKVQQPVETNTWNPLFVVSSTAPDEIITSSQDLQQSLCLDDDISVLEDFVPLEDNAFTESEQVTLEREYLEEMIDFL